MKNSGTIDRNIIGAERVSRRVQNGVEIYERETKRLVIPDTYGDTPQPRSYPKLVIEDAVSRGKLFIAKRRSELSEVDALLRSLAPRTVDAK
jgi:hypothetical protein